MLGGNPAHVNCLNADVARGCRFVDRTFDVRPNALDGVGLEKIILADLVG